VRKSPRFASAPSVSRKESGGRLARGDAREKLLVIADANYFNSMFSITCSDFESGDRASEISKY
jgi:hypothetical protein